MEKLSDEEIIERRNLYVKYLLLKVREGEWHGVCDAGMDLRDHEARYSHIRWQDVPVKA